MGKKNVCVIYARVSSRTQSWGHGIIRQIECCQARAKKSRTGVLGVYVDVARGDGPLPNRDAAIAHAKMLNCPVFVEAYDRWTRSVSNDFNDVPVQVCEPLAEALGIALEGIMKKAMAAS